MSNKELLLTMADKSIIFDSLRHITDDYIIGNKKQSMVFEFLSNNEKSILYDVIKNSDIEFQLKIVKNIYNEVKEKLLSTEYLDLSYIAQRNNEKFNINLKNGELEDIEYKTVEESVLEQFVYDGFIYRHYLIISLTDGDKIKDIVYGFISNIKNSDILLRKLEKNDLYQYLYDEINFGQENKKPDSFKSKINNTNIQRLSKKTNDINGFFWRKVNNLLETGENIFFHNKVDNISNDVLLLLEKDMHKGSNYIRMGDIYKGGIMFKGLPKSNFNILKYVYNFMEAGDSIIINIYPTARHNIGTTKRVGLKGIYGDDSENTNSRNNEVYLQMICAFNEISPYLLEKRINQFQTDLWIDFFSQRIEGTMIKYLQTILGTGENNLMLERSYNNERLQQNLIF